MLAFPEDPGFPYNPSFVPTAHTHTLMSYASALGGILPVTNRCHASSHSWITSIAYFLFLASPLKAKTFSGLPSGI